MKAKFIYEKFTEDSDPIDDLGIGMMHQIKKWIEGQRYGEILELKDNEDYYYIIRFCIVRNKFDFVEYLLDKSNININIDDCIFLRISVFFNKGNFDMAKFLIKKGADLDKAIEIIEEKLNEPTTHKLLLQLKQEIENK